MCIFQNTLKCFNSSYFESGCKKNFTKRFSKKHLYKEILQNKFKGTKTSGHPALDIFTADLNHPEPQTDRKISNSTHKHLKKRETKKSERTTHSTQQHKHNLHVMHSYLMH